MNTTIEKEINIEIFDPPMCCASGLCGPELDPKLLAINDAVITLKKKYEGRANIQRYLLTSHGNKFMQTPSVFEKLQAHGTDALPITLVNGQIVAEKTYPTKVELESFINTKASNLS